MTMQGDKHLPRWPFFSLGDVCATKKEDVGDSERLGIKKSFGSWTKSVGEAFRGSVDKAMKGRDEGGGVYILVVDVPVVGSAAAWTGDPFLLWGGAGDGNREQIQRKSRQRGAGAGSGQRGKHREL